MKKPRETKPKVITAEDSRSTAGKLLGDSLMGSCWRAVEQAGKPDVEVSVYVRSFAEADLALILILDLAGKRGLFDHAKEVDREKVRQNSIALGAVIAVELENGSVIALKREEGT